MYIFSVNNSRSQDLYGLRFNGNDKEIESRTSLKLLPLSQKTFKNKFDLSFDLSFYDPSSIGYICRFIYKEEELSLYYFPYSYDEFCYFDIISNHDNRIIHLPILREKIQQGNWQKFKLSFLPEKDSIYLAVDNVKRSGKYNFLKGYKPDVVFGFHGANPDLPFMCIKDIGIKDHKNNLVSQYQLKEYEGNFTLDEISKNKVPVRNPSWVAKDRYFWKECKRFNSNLVADFCYNDKTNQVYLIGSDSLMIYDVATNKLSSCRYKNQFPVAKDHYHSIYNLHKNRIVVYVFNDLSPERNAIGFAELDLDCYEWVNIEVSRNRPKSLQHSAMLAEDIEYPIAFGGYGSFTFHDKFIAIDPVSKSWEEVPFSGDTISPRMYPAISQNQDGVYYLFGGFGNLTGPQVLGGYHFTDLYSIDTNNKEVKKIWEFPKMDEKFVGSNSMYFNKEDKYLYALCYGHHLVDSPLKLLKISTQKPSYEIVADSIPFASEEILTEAHLYYSKESKKLIAAIREDVNKEHASFRIYTLNFPPINRMNNLEENSYGNKKIYFSYLFVFLLLLVSASILFLIKKRRHSHISTDVTWDYENIKTAVPKTNAIIFFGDFLVRNNMGKDVTHLFPPRLQKLLCLVLLSQIRNEKGINSKEISRIIWPDKDSFQAKNIRSVSFSQLRTALQDVDGIDVVYENKFWKVKYSNEVFIDLIHLVTISKSILEVDIQQLIGDELRKFFVYTSRGQFMPSVHEEWMDNFKSEIETKLVDVISIVLKFCSKSKNNDLGILAANVMLGIAPFSEEAIKSKTKFLKNQGRLQAAKNAYTSFIKNYENNFGSQPNIQK